MKALSSLNVTLSDSDISTDKGAMFEYLSDCAAAIGTTKSMLITSTEAMTVITLSLVHFLVAPHREVSFRRRCSLSFIISLKSTTGRISIGPSPYLKPGSCETS